MSTTLHLLHFNDVYRVQPQKIDPKSTETIDVTQFATLLGNLRAGWPKPSDGLVLFSGDVFSPSVESSITRGSHMVPVMNELAPDISLTGNHDFDFGYPHLSKLMQDTKFPWLLSNVIDNETNATPVGLREFEVFERAGVRIGIIGLVEKEWISTVASWPINFEYRDMKETGIQLSKLLRDPSGEYRCDLIIALTHARVPNDIELAKQLYALSPKAQQDQSIASTHGVDILLGGHDHLYYVSRGVTSWEEYDTTQYVLGAEHDHGDVLLVKSGTDFRDLSAVQLELSTTPADSIRTRVVSRITGMRHTTKPGSPSSEKLAGILKKILSSVSDSLKAPVCISDVVLDLRSQLIRTEESASGNWFADICRHAYDDALCMKGYGGADGTFICAGTLRGDSQYGPGPITLGDIMEILPFEDPMVVLEVDGQTIWDAMESSLETWPAQEGRFPVISGFRVSWDSSKPAGQRVLGIWLTEEAQTPAGDDASVLHATRIVDGPAIERRKDGRKYKIVTREYMAQGHDGFVALQNQKYLIDDEGGHLTSAIVRKYLMGAHYVQTMVKKHDDPNRRKHLHHESSDVILHEKAKKGHNVKHGAHRGWDLVKKLVLSTKHYKDHLNISVREHMSSVDCVDGASMRRHGEQNTEEKTDSQDRDTDDLLVVHPVVDGRLKDAARA